MTTQRLLFHVLLILGRHLAPPLLLLAFFCAAQQAHADLMDHLSIMSALHQFAIPTLTWEQVTCSDAAQMIENMVNAADTTSSRWSFAPLGLCTTVISAVILHNTDACDALLVLSDYCSCAWSVAVARAHTGVSTNPATCAATHAHHYTAIVPPSVATSGPDVMSEYVVCRQVALELPADTNQWWELLWARFVGTPEEKQFDAMRTDNWQTNWVRFATALCAHARAQSLPHASLRQCLAHVRTQLPSNKAMLPVGAYYLALPHQLVWIIVCKWEYACLDETLSHICIYALDAATCAELSYVTCN